MFLFLKKSAMAKVHMSQSYSGNKFVKVGNDWPVYVLTWCVVCVAAWKAGSCSVEYRRERIQPSQSEVCMAISTLLQRVMRSVQITYTRRECGAFPGLLARDSGGKGEVGHVAVHQKVCSHLLMLHFLSLLFSVNTLLQSLLTFSV